MKIIMSWVVKLGVGIFNFITSRKLLMGIFYLFLFMVFVIPTTCMVLLINVDEFSTCGGPVIDSYEANSKLNIPAINEANCHYDEEENLRISVYSLRANYQRFGRFECINKEDALHLLSGLYLLDEEELPVSNNLLIARGESTNGKWVYLYEKESKRLWCSMDFNNM